MDGSSYNDEGKIETSASATERGRRGTLGLTVPSFSPSVPRLGTAVVNISFFRNHESINLLPHLLRNESLDPPLEQIVRIPVDVVESSMSRILNQAFREFESGG